MKKRKRNTKLAVAYIRISKDKHELGPAGQAKEIRQWCRDNGVELACDPFEDHGVSGARDFDKRPGLMQAIRALDEHAAGVLVAHKRDRIARSVDVMSELRLLMRRSGIRICTTEHPFDSDEDDDPMTKAMQGVTDVFAEMERGMIAMRTRAALAMKRGRGERTGTVPYGYKLARDGVHVVKDAKEQRVVQLIKKLRAEGLSLRVIAAELTARGIKPRSGKKWHPQVVSSIANSEPVEIVSQ